MIRYCKNPKCNQELKAFGRQTFCSDKCRKAYSYMKTSGKITPGEAPNLTVPDGTESERELMGTVVKITTTSGGKKQVHIEFDLFESSGISDFLKKPAKVLFYSEIEEEKDHDPTDDLFSDYDPYIDGVNKG